jgi:hypothetical protein
MIKRIIIYATPLYLLGYRRGINDYDYQYKKDKDYMDITYLYSRRIGVGIFGGLCYMNPFFMPIFIIKEIYRLEVHMRELEEEKKSDYYNRLF